MPSDLLSSDELMKSLDELKSPRPSLTRQNPAPRATTLPPKEQDLDLEAVKKRYLEELDFFQNLRSEKIREKNKLTDMVAVIETRIEVVRAALSVFDKLS